MIALGIDAWNLPGDRRGIGRYLREILRVWWERHRDRVEVVLVVPEWHTWTVARRYLREVEDRPYRVVSRRFHGRAGLDALWFPFNGCSWTNFSLPSVATLHDASNFFVPDYGPQAQSLFRIAAQRCAALITDSEFARAELARALSIPPERLESIPLGVRPPLPPAPVALDVGSLRPFVLYVGALEERKGFDTVLDACARVQRLRPEMTLAITTELGAWRERARDVRVAELGFVDDATLAALYRGCEAFLFPSRYEGFGLPVLEALSYGAAVVASNGSSLPEAGGDAVRYVDPGDGEAAARAVLSVGAEPDITAELRRRGLARAASMTWERTAERTLDVVERLVRA